MILTYLETNDAEKRRIGYALSIPKFDELPDGLKEIVRQKWFSEQIALPIVLKSIILILSRNLSGFLATISILESPNINKKAIKEIHLPYF